MQNEDSLLHWEFEGIIYLFYSYFQLQITYLVRVLRAQSLPKMIYEFKAPLPPSKSHSGFEPDTLYQYNRM